MNGTIVCKFGGSSLASAPLFARVSSIVHALKDRCIVVPSAPGKRSPADKKITDLLYSVHARIQEGRGLGQEWEMVYSRFITLAREAGAGTVLTKPLEQVRKDLLDGCSQDYAASRGEFLNGLLLARVIGFEFVDAAEVILFSRNGKVDPATYDRIADRCKPGGKYVIPGFYGGNFRGGIQTFSRGGSDVTGAIVAAAVNASVYENWTDVDGIASADPRVVENAASIRTITYGELRELTYMGASVFHDEAVAPVWESGIPIHIRNTMKPQDKGTMIVGQRDVGNQVVVGVAGKPGFTVFNISKGLMHGQTGIAADVLNVFKDAKVSIEHCPTGIDTMSVVVSNSCLNGQSDTITQQLRLVLYGAEVSTSNSLGLIATVGLGMANHPGTAARLFSAIAREGVNIRLIDQGSSENNIIVGVNEDELPKAIRCIYAEFFGS